MAEKTLEIILKARDLASRPLDGLKDKIQQTRDAINQTKGGKGGLGDIARSVGDVSKLHQAVSAVEMVANAATGVAQAGSAVFKTWKGDAEGAAEAVKATGEAFRQIPVAGKAFDAGNFIGQWLFGDQKDADTAIKEIERIESTLKRAMADAQARRKELAFAEAQATTFANRGRTRGLGGSDLAAEQEKISYEEIDRKLRESLERAKSKSSGLNAAALETELKPIYDAIEAAYADHAAAMQEIEDKRFADAKAAEQKRGEMVAQERERVNEIVKDAQRQAYMDDLATKEAALRLSGDAVAADALAIKAAWEREAQGIKDAKARAMEGLPASATEDEAKSVVDAYERSYTAAWDRFQMAQAQREQDEAKRREDAARESAQRIAAEQAEAMKRSLAGFGVTQYGSSLPRGSQIGFRPEQNFAKIEDVTRDSREELRKQTPAIERSRDYLSAIDSDTDKLADVVKGTAATAEGTKESVRILRDVLAALQRLGQGTPLQAANLTGGP